MTKSSRKFLDEFPKIKRGQEQMADLRVHALMLQDHFVNAEREADREYPEEYILRAKVMMTEIKEMFPPAEAVRVETGENS